MFAAAHPLSFFFSVTVGFGSLSWFRLSHSTFFLGSRSLGTGRRLHRLQLGSRIVKRTLQQGDASTGAEQVPLYEGIGSGSGSAQHPT